MSKIKCYSCNQLGHYARDCTQVNKKRKDHANATDMDESLLPKKTIETLGEEFVF